MKTGESLPKKLEDPGKAKKTNINKPRYSLYDYPELPFADYTGVPSTLLIRVLYEGLPHNQARTVWKNTACLK